MLIALCLIGASQLANPVELIPVDAGVADRNVLSTSLRIQPQDMRLDQAFERLYRVEGTRNVYVRRAGGLYAVFRDPLYADTSDGAIPLVPAGTVYCIGSVSPYALGQLGQLATPSVPEQASNSTAPPRAWTPPPPRPSGPRHLRASIRFMEDEDYRRQRLASFVLESLADAREATGSARAGAPEADELEEVGDVDGAVAVEVLGHVAGLAPGSDHR